MVVYGLKNTSGWVLEVQPPLLCEDEAKSAWVLEVQQGNLLGLEEKAASRSPERGEGAAGSGQAQRTQPRVPPTPGMRWNFWMMLCGRGIPASPQISETLPSHTSVSVHLETLQKRSGRRAGILSIFSKERLAFPTHAISITALSYA